MGDSPATPPLPLADDGGVKAFDRLGGKISVPADQVSDLIKMGGRVATPQEDAAERTQAAYDKQSLGTKVATVASMAGPIGYPLHAYLRGEGAVLPPELEAYTQGVSQGFTGGAASVGMKTIIGEVGGEKAAHAYGQTAHDVSETHAGLHSAGELAGFIGGAVAGGPKAGLGGAGKLIPGVGIGALGGLAEQGAARVLAPIAARGAIGRALATGGELAARGAVEGALYGGAHQITEDMLGDHAVVADKVFAASGMGALYGGAGGAALGAGGSLAASGARATFGGIRRALARGGSEVASEAAARTSADLADGTAALQADHPLSINPDAGLGGPVPAHERPFNFGPGKHTVGLDSALERDFAKPIRGEGTPIRGHYEADAGAVGRDAMNYPPVIGDWRGPSQGVFGRQQFLHETGGALETEAAPLFGKRFGIDESGAMKVAMDAAPGTERDAIKIARGKTGPRDVSLRADDATSFATQSPISIARGAEGVAAAAQPEVSAIRQALGGDANGAARSAANTMAFDALGTTRKIADKINKEVAGGTKAVGDYVNRRIIPQVAGNEGGLIKSTFNAARGGRADDLLPLIQADKAVIGSGIGDIVKATPVRVSADELMAGAARIAKEMSSDPTRIHGAEPFQKQIAQTFEAFTNGGKLVNGTMDLSDAYYARAQMEGIAREMKRGNSAAGEAMKDWLRDVDSHLVSKIDEAARAMGDTGAKDKLLGLKREYQLAASAEKAAEDGAHRIAGNNSIGLREGIGAAVGAATGHLLPALAAGVGGKLLRERGSAAGAHLMTKLADMGTLTRALKAVDDQIGRASKGMLAAAPARALPEAASATPMRQRAAAVMDKYAQIASDPAKYAETVADHTNPLVNSTPMLAGALTQRLTDAAAFMSTKIPVHPDPDPFDPHPAARLSDAQASTLLRYDAYIDRPMLFFEEVERGKITHEGVDVVRALMPGAFAEMQQRTVEGLADLMAIGKKPPYAQRERLGILLDVPAVPSQRPEHMGFLQQNMLASTPAPKTPGAVPPKRPIATKSQPSTLDRLEGR